MTFMEEITKKRSKYAITSFLLSLIFFIPLTDILAVIFGIAALIKIHKFRHILKGESIAIVGIILGTIRLLFLVFMVVLFFAIAPQLKPNLREVKQNMRIAKVYIDFLRLEQLVNKYYQEYQKIPPDLLILKKKGLVKTLPRDPFSKNKQIYRYKPKGQIKKVYPKADFLIYSVGPDADDDEARKQYSTKDGDGDIIKIGRVKTRLMEQ
jgi:hypothetical protein